MLNSIQKASLLKNHKYSMDVPDTTHANWTTSDWISWIDARGKWSNVHVCGFCGSLEEPISEGGSYPFCPDCKAV